MVHHSLRTNPDKMSIFDWRGETSLSLCEQHRRCDVVRQFLLNILSSLKARLGAFWRENREISMAAMPAAMRVGNS